MSAYDHKKAQKTRKSIQSSSIHKRAELERTQAQQGTRGVLDCAEAVQRRTVQPWERVVPVSQCHIENQRHKTEPTLCEVQEQTK